MRRTAGRFRAPAEHLGQLYQQTAILYLAAENTQEAKSRLEKATTLSPRDPGNFALLGRVINADYLTQLKSMPEGKAKQLDGMLDQVIDKAREAATAVSQLTGQP